MKQRLYSLLIALTFTTNIVPLTVNSTLLEKSGKRVLLLGDVHDQNIEGTLRRYSDELNPTQKILAQAALSTLDNVKRKQKKEFTNFAHTMIGEPHKHSSQTILVAENSVTELKSFYWQTSQALETMDVLPHVLVNHLAQSAPTPAEKLTALEQSLTSFGINAKTAFQVNNGIHFVAGNYCRDNNLDILLEQIRTEKDLRELKKTLPDNVAQINVGDLKEVLLTWQNLFTGKEIKEVDTATLLIFIDEGVKTNTISNATPVIDLAIQLQENNPAQRQNLSSLLFHSASKKCDLELALHVKSFEKDVSLKYLILNAGAAHTDFIKTRVIKDGYAVVESSGSDVILSNEFKKASRETTLTMLSKMLDQVKKQSPLVMLPKLFQA